MLLRKIIPCLHYNSSLTRHYTARRWLACEHPLSGRAEQQIVLVCKYVGLSVILILTNIPYYTEFILKLRNTFLTTWKTFLMNNQ